MYKAASKLLIAILVVSFLAVLIPIPQASAVAPTITRVQGPTAATVTTAGITSFLVTLPEAPTQGNVIVAIITCSNTHNVASITQTGVTWAQATSSTSNYNTIALWYGIVGVSPVAAANITMTGGSGEESGFTAIMCEYSGLDTVNPLDQTSNSSGINSNGYTGITEYTYPYVLAVGGVVSQHNSASSPTNNFTLVDTDVAILTHTAYLEKTNNPAYGTQLSSNVTFAGSTYWAGCIATFKAASYDYLYTFNGIYDENIGTYIVTGSANITAYFESGEAACTFTVNGTSAYAPTVKPTYFSMAISDGTATITREYWLTETENTANITLYHAAATAYVINFLDYTGILKTYQYITASVNINGELAVVEQRKVDVQNSVTMELVNGKKYQITITNSESYVYGDLLMTASTGVQLTIRGAEFPKETLLTQKNVHIYATRNFTADSIEVVYEDLLNDTANVDITIAYQNGTVAYTYVANSSSFTVTWANAVDETSYYLTATITHNQYGALLYRQVFMAENTAQPPFSLAWMGSLAFDTAYLFPALLILFVAGCFSALNAEVGAILVSIMAIILTVMGWIPIPAGALVSAMFFSILMALIYNKRRVVTY